MLENLDPRIEIAPPGGPAVEAIAAPAPVPMGALEAARVRYQASLDSFKRFGRRAYGFFSDAGSLACATGGALVSGGCCLTLISGGAFCLGALGGQILSKDYDCDPVSTGLDAALGAAISLVVVVSCAASCCLKELAHEQSLPPIIAASTALNIGLCALGHVINQNMLPETVYDSDTTAGVSVASFVTGALIVSTFGACKAK